MMKKVVLGLLGVVVLGGCSHEADVPPDQSMGGQLQGLKHGPMGDKDGTKGGVTKAGKPGDKPSEPNTIK